MTLPDHGLEEPRSTSQIRQQLKQVIFRHLQKELRGNFRRHPGTCRHNIEVPLGDGLTVGVCNFMVNGDPRRVLCDARNHGVEQAHDCGLWEPWRSKDEVKSGFRTLIDSGDRGLIAVRYPDVAALMWVLGIADVSDEIRGAESELDALAEPATD